MAIAPPTAPQAAVMNLPNLLTMGRLGLAIVLFACIAFEAWAWALAIFLLAAFSDWLDGYLARKHGLTTAFGRNFDPLVDKVLNCGAFIFLMPVASAGLTPWMVTVVVARELIITGLRGFMESQATSFGADWLGKLKMLLQCAALIAIFLVLALRSAGQESGSAVLHSVQLGLVWAMVIATAASGLQYLWRAVVLLRPVM